MNQAIDISKLIVPISAVVAVVLVVAIIWVFAMGSAGRDRERSKGVEIGCGSLVVIAIIVAIFGSSSARKVQSEVHDLKDDVRALKSVIETQSKDLQKIREAIEKLQPAPPPEKAERDEGGAP